MPSPKKSPRPQTIKAKVVFRVWKSGIFTGAITALLPEIPADMGGIYCSSYDNAGHGAADFAHVMNSTRPARPNEYRVLAKQMRRIGYCLTIRQRGSASDYAARRAALKFCS